MLLNDLSSEQKEMVFNILYCNRKLHYDDIDAAFSKAQKDYLDIERDRADIIKWLYRIKSYVLRGVKY